MFASLEQISTKKVENQNWPGGLTVLVTSVTTGEAIFDDSGLCPAERWMEALDGILNPRAAMKYGLSLWMGATSSEAANVTTEESELYEN